MNVNEPCTSYDDESKCCCENGARWCDDRNLLFKVDVFDDGGVGVVHPDAPDVCGRQSEINQSLLLAERDSLTYYSHN